MPTYEFRCRACGDTFTEARPMSASNDPACCPEGHDDTVRLLSIAGNIRSDRRAPVGCPNGEMPDGCCGGGGCG
ncbi:MAG: zinc ribbon domain-containing protein [Candidatus Nanopelagicales bacterium]|nr:zinc ribbon domain-containing protein [Candidatus Nanopelagicales bacterium]MDZ4249599.1 zinc ribbon domain-containing protein [Candidatus Nanopelagicales bacterium]MDZ7577612.1 zinc ribbon domain-containing protein [Candidatus Nanopelagicales bacterium]